MHIFSAAILLLPLALAHQDSPASHPHRRHHARAIVDANRPIPRAGAVIDNGTLASISQYDAQISATQSSIASIAPTSTTNDDDDAAVTSSASSAADSGKAGVGPSTTVVLSDAASSTLSSTTSSDLASPSVTSDTSKYQFLSLPHPPNDSSTSTSLSTSASTSHLLIPVSSFISVSSMNPNTSTSTTDKTSHFSSTGTSTSTSTLASPTVTSTEAAPVTLSSSTTTPAAVSTTAHSTIVLVTTASKTSTTHKASSTAESAETEKKSSGLSKTALIAIIVVASVVGAAGIGWTLFRKWKLRPSNRFGKKMNPIDFSPHNNDMNDDFFEKTLQRTASNSSASRQRRELVAELDDPHAVPGVPPHDFTAGTAGVGAGVGAGYAMYNQDPYSHAEQYDYETAYDQHQQHPQGDIYDQHQHQYPPSAYTQDPQGYAGYVGAPTQDQPINDGYADLQRGNSIGSGSGHGHGHVQALHHDQQVYPGELSFPSADQYGLGRPTGGAEGPYAQAAQYRGY
ncbi:uncharacterized protein IL334_004873 [Kwoniella shivajii]|uniref:Mid2 domain-containing protein n=1 Tax=Kwoniella shivajii TaxID=564305 RepID=A0ABZ1D1K5_9TREE|nr:hypothetical protein IL334_004873 [Kwoniella shivajii]